MSYYFNKTLTANFESVKEKVIAELSKEGFGILSEIDVQATFKKKLDVDFRKYQILGACNPTFAHKALNTEDKVGTMLPCNVILQELENGKVEVAAVNATASMQAIDNEKLKSIASEISGKLQKVIAAL
ncbi:MAG: DUF302 domain-containing protein [Dysgonamonadaceae bacterium]|nr:DUF302 domain-containing protein [Dysgonamonadaceae bacterium]MDD4729205.1 DUF302 domain-containing protein [Dysgonamonadaceae bacterium]